MIVALTRSPNTHLINWWLILTQEVTQVIELEVSLKDHVYISTKKLNKKIGKKQDNRTCNKLLQENLWYFVGSFFVGGWNLFWVPTKLKNKNFFRSYVIIDK